jgi:hypothetical protein
MCVVSVRVFQQRGLTGKTENTVTLMVPQGFPFPIHHFTVEAAGAGIFTVVSTGNAFKRHWFKSFKLKPVKQLKVKIPGFMLQTPQYFQV